MCRPTADEVAEMADRGHDISRFFTNQGAMKLPRDHPLHSVHLSSRTKDWKEEKMDEPKTTENNQELEFSLQQFVQLLGAGVELVFATIREVVLDEQFQRALQAIDAVADEMTFRTWVQDASADSGFLPHRSVPFDKFYRESKGNYDLFSSRVSDYFGNHEGDILQSIESYLKGSAIDAERKETALEVIAAHKYELFRVTTRALLPDIERIILEDWMGKKREDVMQLSKEKIRQAVNAKYLEDFVVDNVYDLSLFDGLINVLYENGSKIKDFQGDIFPNRPAALHGWLPYSTRQYSLNTIILAEYVIRLVPIFKGRRN